MNSISEHWTVTLESEDEERKRTEEKEPTKAKVPIVQTQ